jgi:demethylmenaquinone methyltransferase/2-methoxy-6-polyprenyl-1,4-benzoquinol methylase
MIETKEVIEFFDRLAPGWDAEMVRSDEIIRIILDNAGVTAGKNVLDVACGTGVLIPDSVLTSGEPVYLWL